MERETQWASGGGLWFSVFFLSVFYTGRKHINTHLTYIFACLHNSRAKPLPLLHPQTQMHTQPHYYYEVFFVIKG